MIINISKVKSESLLLFCRDLIESYKKDSAAFDIDEQLKQFVDERTDQLLKAINVYCQDIPYYLRNAKVSRISMILKGYNFLNDTLSKKLQQRQLFNPAMLCFTLLSTWFAELSQCKDDKDFLFFTRYPYSEIYDKLLIEVENEEYKKLNLSMLLISEEAILKLHGYGFK